MWMKKSQGTQHRKLFFNLIIILQVFLHNEMFVRRVEDWRQVYAFYAVCVDMKDCSSSLFFK
jgi:hypothetical protein